MTRSELGEKMTREDPVYFDCTIAVASFTKNSQALVSINNESAFWWLYGGLGNWSSCTDLLVSEGSLGLGKFNMTSDALTFCFSEGYETANANDGHVTDRAAISMRKEEKRGPVTPTTFTLNLHVCRQSNLLDINFAADIFVIGAFSFDEVTWIPLAGASTKLKWPT